MGNSNCPGAKSNREPCCYPAPLLRSYPTTEGPDCSPKGTCFGFVSAIVRYLPPPPPPPPPKDYLNGFVFGMGEWSHPDTTLDDAKRSLAETADVGANAVEFTPYGFQRVHCVHPSHITFNFYLTFSHANHGNMQLLGDAHRCQLHRASARSPILAFSTVGVFAAS